MILAWINRWDDGAVTTGSELTNLPGSNTQHPHLTRKWHTASGVKSSHAVVDLGAPQAAALAAVLGTNFTAAATIRVRADNTDPTGAAGGQLDTGTLTGKFAKGACYEVFTSASARYWRVDLGDTALPDNLQVGRIVLAPYWDAKLNLEYGWQISPRDLSSRLAAPGGNVFSQKRPQQREISFSLAFASEADMYGNGFAAASAAGQIKDVLCLPQSASAFRWDQAVWGLIEDPVPIIHEAALQYRARYTVRERI